MVLCPKGFFFQEFLKRFVFFRSFFFRVFFSVFFASFFRKGFFTKDVFFKDFFLRNCLRGLFSFSKSTFFHGFVFFVKGFLKKKDFQRGCISPKGLFLFESIFC